MGGAGSPTFARWTVVDATSEPPDAGGREDRDGQGDDDRPTGRA